VLSVKLGRLLGTSGGNESATEIPPSFAIDELAQRVLVLDAVHSRIVSFDMAGKVREKRKLKTKSKTASDVVVDAPNHRTIVLDQAKDTITDISGSRQTVVSDVGAGGRPFGSRLTYDTRGDTAYVRDVAQGSFVPVLARGQRTSAAEQRAGTRSGAPTSIGDLALEVSDSSVTFGLTGSDPHGYQIDFADQVLEATDAVVDGEGIIWALVGLYKADSAATMLVRLDPATGESKAAQVPTAVPGDVTRRLAGARRGVLFLTGRSQTIDLIRYETL
jgi:hypothetical protein